MEQLGDKIAAKKVAVETKVPVIPDNKEPLTSVEIALAEAQIIGYPIMLKAAAGGGGRGMRRVYSDEELRKGFNEAQREAGNAFGDDTLFMENLWCSQNILKCKFWVIAMATSCIYMKEIVHCNAVFKSN